MCSVQNQLSVYVKKLESSKMESISNSSLMHPINPKSPVTIPLTNRLSVRLYEDSRPHCLETAALQKGLVLMIDNKELIEEGLGFGTPVVKYQDKTYFSGSSSLSIQKTPCSYRLTKAYVFDLISKKLWKDHPIDDRLYSKWRKKFARLYLGHKELLPLFNRLMELRDTAKIRTEFMRVNPRGIVKVNYEIKPREVEISVDFSELTINGCEELLVLNEQGSSFFETYSDSSGLKLEGGRIGGWAPVNAKRASLLWRDQRVDFTIQKISGATLFRGWERTKNRFSWAGLSYSMSSDHKSFDYTIDLDLKPIKN